MGAPPGRCAGLTALAATFGARSIDERFAAAVERKLDRPTCTAPRATPADPEVAQSLCTIDAAAKARLSEASARLGDTNLTQVAAIASPPVQAGMTTPAPGTEKFQP